MPFSGKEADYTIDADDKYYVRVINTNPRSIIMSMSVNVTSKMYDLTSAKSVCSTSNGSCKLHLHFPTTQYVVVTTPSNVSPFLSPPPLNFLMGFFVELSNGVS